MPQTLIAQDDLLAVVREYQAVVARADAINRRLDAGAEVEPGPFSVESLAVPDASPLGTTQHATVGGIQVAPASETLPEWVTETPRGTQYTISVWDRDETVEEVDVTLAEYLLLKQRLVALRGYELPKEENANA